MGLLQQALRALDVARGDDELELGGCFKKLMKDTKECLLFAFMGATGDQEGTVGVKAKRFVHDLERGGVRLSCLMV